MMGDGCKETIVVGGGVAGCTAGLYAQRYNLDLVLLEKGAPGGQIASASHVENYPGFPDGINGLELAQRVHEQAAKAGVEFVLGEAQSVERRGNLWVLHTDKGEMPTVSLIVATGASPRPLKIPGERDMLGQGVSFCATCDGMLYRKQTVAVVGGGNTALDEALYLADICEKVYLIHRRDQLRAEAYMQERLFAQPNVEVVWDAVPVEVLGEAGGAGVTGIRVRNVKTEATRDIDITGLFVAIGHAPQTEWLQGTVEMKDGFVLTDREMRTSAEGIFAAGDIRDTPLRQITTAVGDASIAAYTTWQYVSARRPAR